MVKVIHKPGEKPVLWCREGSELLYKLYKIKIIIIWDRLHNPKSKGYGIFKGDKSIHTTYGWSLATELEVLYADAKRCIDLLVTGDQSNV